MSDPPPKPSDARRDGEREVPSDLAGRALDGAVRTLFGVSWGEARKWIASGKVRVDGEIVTDALKYVRKGALVRVTMSAPKRAKAGRGGERVVLDDEAIVFLDSHVIVVNKPSGVSTIPYEGANEVLRAAGAARAARSGAETLDELVRAWLSKRVKKGERDTRPQLGVVHRLDKETSGVLVFTRSWLGKQSLALQFRAHTVHRRYLAIAHGAVQAGTIRSQLVADRGDGLRGSLRPGRKTGNQEGQLAITHVEVVAKLDGATLIACRLETGRTHQIRVHLSEAGHPIVGERVYVRGFVPPQILAPRLMLHAAELGFVHPATNVEVRFEREPPKDFEETLARLE
jgi:23S rRNA pseudouridine1911/1915/1917 synthase